MNVITTTNRTSRHSQLTLRIVVVMIALLAAISSGCSRLRLPAIDPNGSCLFSALPTTTTLALPGSGGEGCGCLGCLSNLGSCLKTPNCLSNSCLSNGFRFPTPAFADPIDPPPCAVPAPATGALGASNEPCVPSAPCNGTCLTGPRAVLLGGEIDQNDCSCKLPDRGKRGCILLSPQKIVAPVGGEVVLLSGVCGTDGYLQMNEKLEWMLTPDSVGTFIQVGDDQPGVIGKLVGSQTRPEKKDPSYAIGITSTKRTLITRGNTDVRDDVQLEKGQTWLTISSPSEGISRVTVLAPESECWDQRKATATIYWVDAKWQFPAPQIVPAGTPVELTTRVTRSEGLLPAKGWKVRYEVLDPSLASFAGTSGSSVVEANVDDSGNATVQLIPTPGTSGITPVAMQIIRPGGATDNLPSLTLGQGQTFVTWSSPKLAIRAGAPEIASFGAPYNVFANLSNPGDQPATNVRVDLQLPPGTKATVADSFARIVPNGVTWEIGTVPPQTQLDLSVELISEAPVSLTFTARGDGLVAEDSVRVDVFRPSLKLEVNPVEDRVESGLPVTFNIDVTNTSDRPLTNPKVVVTGDNAMIHESGEARVESARGSTLQPGETWKKQVVYTPMSGGRRCINVEATTDGGQLASRESCITAINPIPKTPTLSARIDSLDRVAVGQNVTATAQIFNEGRGVARNVRVEMVYDPQLQPVQATEGYDNTRMGQNIITWTVPEIQPGDSAALAGEFRAIASNPRAAVRIRAVSEEGATANANLFIDIADSPTQPRQPQPRSLPPAGPPPSIPGGPAPLQGAPQELPAPAPLGPQRSGRMQTIVVNRDNPVRVNDPIRYSVRIINDTNERDSNIDIQFPLPDGVKLERLVPLTNPELGQYEIKNNFILLPYVPSLEPGESVEYEVVLSSNQPQTFNFDVSVRSDNQPGGYNETVPTTVVP
ncbi:Large cysteine-rich periplasmic protein omcB precursor [Rubripirellula amarantea]|uniref:Large cysteine-rich periplasmic protein omcB n=1 Tax=Rubripirellula amarantea TaxID=2527999 RepID=A0A5C5WX37_9BACT|nr:DUF11 domain-containing protein [Rubripirellula amarantea]TWT55130.1 Large cysteine-rich periplasmic protein omcB precursor [Rubripirellula amarantea]